MKKLFAVFLDYDKSRKCVSTCSNIFSDISLILCLLKLEV